MNKYILISIAFATFFTACTKNEPIYSTKIYENISNNDILNATKKVLHLADPKFKIASNSNSIEAKRVLSIYKIYDIQLKINTISLSTQTDNDTVIAKLKIKQKKDYFDKVNIITNNSVHNLLWDRIDYILGLNKNWPTCFEYNVKLNSDGIICNRLYNKNYRAYKKDIIVHKMQNKNKDDSNELEQIDLESLGEISLPNFEIDNNENTDNIIDLEQFENIDINNTGTDFNITNSNIDLNNTIQEKILE